jgi:hypothetical protein
MGRGSRVRRDEDEESPMLRRQKSTGARKIFMIDLKISILMIPPVFAFSCSPFSAYSAVMLVCWCWSGNCRWAVFVDIKI